jgi:hypothetical protein
MSQELIEFVNTEIPATLRPISLFLIEAQRAMRYNFIVISTIIINVHVDSGRLSSVDAETALSYTKITVCAINHAFKVFFAIYSAIL